MKPTKNKPASISSGCGLFPKSKSIVGKRRRPQEKPPFFVYLSGSIAKVGHSGEHLYWGLTEKQAFKKGVNADVVCFDPADREDDISSGESVVGRDLLMVLLADAVIVDARQRRGVGVGAEVIFADQMGTPSLPIIPAETHYNKMNAKILGREPFHFIHPFLKQFASDKQIYDDFDSAGKALSALMSSTSKWDRQLSNLTEQVKGCFRFYIKTQLTQDKVFHSCLESHPELNQRLNQVERALSVAKHKPLAAVPVIKPREQQLRMQKKTNRSAVMSLRNAV